jgi:ribonucleotide reductase beta subunit family protein with ferritin-like domain
MVKQLKKKLKLTDVRDTFKPFSYPWAYDLWLKHEQIHWIHSLVNMQQDVADWKTNLSESQKNYLTQIFRLFTQGDIDVAGAYVDNYLPTFPQPEIRMMLLGFAAREAVHIAAYSHLMETLGFRDDVYDEFLNYKEMTAKHDFFAEITGSDKDQIVQQMCAVSAFTEGMQLFSSFAMLLNFGRNNLMPGMTKIISWSIIDETCLIGGTEILTTTGWKQIQHVTLDDIVLQFDINNGEVGFVHPNALTHTIKCESYVFESDYMHQHTTSDHRMIVGNDDGSFVDITAENITENHKLVLNGTKVVGYSELTIVDKSMISAIVSGSESVQWIYDTIPQISSTWAIGAINYYLDQLVEDASNDIQQAFDTLANIAGGNIVNTKLVMKHTHNNYTKTQLKHDPLDFYCITVPGTALVIRSNGKISVTGNCHVEGIVLLFRTFVKENRDIWTDELKTQLYSIAERMVELEDGFIELAYGVMDGSEFKQSLLKSDMHTYIRYIADRRLIQLGLKPIFKQKKNPLPWIDQMISLPSHSNFFEQDESSYSKGALTGNWDDVWGTIES